MIHTREEVIARTIKEFELLDRLVSGLTDEQWSRPLPRAESKDPWTVKDALAHITHWKADVARSIRRQHRPPEERGLNYNDGNHLVYMRWRDRTPQEVLAWHRQVQEDVLAALREADDTFYSGKERGEEWPTDLTSHSAYHRVKEIEAEITRQAIDAGLEKLGADDQRDRRMSALAAVKHLRESMPVLNTDIVTDIQQMREERDHDLIRGD